MVATLTPLPDPPARLALSNAQFVALMDAWMIAQKLFQQEMNDEVIPGINAVATAAFSGTSTTSLAIGTGSKSLSMQSGRAFSPGQTVIVAHDGANYMRGTVTSYNSSTGALVLNSTNATGSGTFAVWSLALSLAPADLAAYLPLIGGTLTGLLELMASVSGSAPLRIPHGVAPSSQVDGDFWTTTAGAFMQIAGVIRQIAMTSGAQTLTSKTLSSPTINNGTINGGSMSGVAIAPRVIAAGSTSGTLTPDFSTTDTFIAAGLTGGITLAAPSGTPVTEQKLTLYLRDNGASRTITWTTSAGGFRAGKDITLPTATIAGKLVRVACIWNAADGYLDVVAVVAQA